MNASLFIRSSLMALSLAGLVVAPQVGAQVPLADQPVFSAVSVPGNLALALSVEFPTAISVAHPNRTYSDANTYLGYFDPKKCYEYRYTDGTSTDNYFYPSGLAANHVCSGKWSGNYLNWASMQTIDPFRWALTGGYRVIDTSSLTVLEKAWGTSQGSTNNFPDSNISGASLVSGATPFLNTNLVSTRIWSLGNKIRFVAPKPGGLNGASFNATYYNNKTLTAPAIKTETVGFINYNVNGPWFPSGVPTTNVSASWVGTVTAPSSGTYTFKARADDGVRLTVQVNNGASFTLGDTGWKDQGATDYTLSVTGVTTGDTLNITMQYYQGGGGAEVSLQWKKPGDTAYTNVGGGDTPPFTATATHYNPSNDLQAGTLYEAFVRVKVCDPSGGAGGVEDNCTVYPNGKYKPTGLMQKYADKIRYSAFGYLNDSNLQRDGGVLRAAQKFIGPTKPVPGSSDIANPLAEWDATTGVMVTNPDSGDASATTTNTGVTVSNSGVMNYLNKFGEINTGSYKTYDPVGELYYAVQRYFRNKGNVPEYTSMTGANLATKTTWVDGFPVITDWKDPILYACQRNFILGIGDVNTHADRNLPGATGSSEPTMPGSVTADLYSMASNPGGVNALDWTNKVGVLQGLGNSLGTTQNYGGCCNNNGALMAGLAYWANVSDIRPDLAGTQTIQTYWLDVLEYQQFKSNNQYYLAAKYGGFTVPANYSADTATPSQFADNAATKFWWSTTADKTNDGKPRPDNYFSAAQADQMVNGLTSAFNSIATKLKAYSTSFSTALPQVSALGVAAYSAQYDTKAWTGELIASSTTFDPVSGQPTLQAQWTLSSTLATQAAGTGWNTARNIVTYNTSTKTGVPFRSTAGGVSSDQLTALDTSYVGGNDSVNYLNYLRGDRTNEQSSVASGSTHAYRDRGSLLGDIVGAKTRPVGPPAAPYSDANNPGYTGFKTTYANRTPMVYVASNDGMVHAVDGSLTGATAGKEVWAYIPGALFNGPTNTPSVNGLASLGNPTFTHHYLVDATPLVIDLDFGKTPGGSGTDWRTILVGGLGKGGKAIYALDITNPASVTSEATAATKVLWEFTDSDLGYTYGTPVIAKTKKYGWTLVFGSGYNNADGKGYIYFVNPRTGALLQKVAVPCADCSASKQTGLTHLNAFVLNLADGLADAIYGGDLLGNVWRLDVTGTDDSYPTPVKFASLTGSDGNPLPVTSKVVIAVQPGSNRRYVTVGTGRMLDQSDISNSQAQRFFAIIDGNSSKFNNDGTLPGTSSDLPPGITFPIKVANLKELTDLTTKITLDLTQQVGWFYDLGVSAAGPGWRVVSDPASFYGIIAFIASSPSSSDACSPSGSSRVYAIDLGSGSMALTGTGQNPDGSTKPYFDGLNGLIIDLGFYSINVNGTGMPRIIVSSNDGTKNPGDNQKALTPVTQAALGLQRMNWREILTPN